MHREFSHLPGIIKIAASGKKLSTPNHEQSQSDQGNDWVVDEQSLKNGLLYGAEHHQELRQSLKHRYSEVVDFHDVNKIKRQWVDELNQQYEQSFNKKDKQLLPSNLTIDRQRYLIDSEPLEKAMQYQIESAPVEMDIQYQMRNPFAHSNTGKLTDKGIFCFTSKHIAGHCVHGHNVVPQGIGIMKVQFFIDILNPEKKDMPLVNLEVYDNRGDEIICLETMSVEQLLPKSNDLSLHFSANPNQCLEFRVYWHGTADIRVRNIKLL